MSETRSVEPILVIEDSLDDFAALERGLRQSGLANPLFHCVNGDDAIDYLYRHNRYSDPADAPSPGLILLDLNMPGTDGREVLSRIKAHPTLCRIPIVILTTSSDPMDIDHCYAMGANSYIQKPVDLRGFVQAIEQLTDYWFSIVLLPRPEAA